jgi:hypothetical protein
MVIPTNVKNYKFIPKSTPSKFSLMKNFLYSEIVKINKAL